MSKGERKKIVVIEQTADGPVKHIFYGDVEVEDQTKAKEEEKR